MHEPTQTASLRLPAGTLERADAIRRAIIARGGPILATSATLARATLAGLAHLERDLGLPVGPSEPPARTAAPVDAPTALMVTRLPGDPLRPIVADTNPSRARRAHAAAAERLAAGCTCPTSRHRRGCPLAGAASPALPTPPPVSDAVDFGLRSNAVAQSLSATPPPVAAPATPAEAPAPDEVAS